MNENSSSNDNEKLQPYMYDLDHNLSGINSLKTYEIIII